MRVPINLASEPFRHNRPMLIGSTICAVLLAALLGLQIYLIRGGQAEARDARVGVRELTQQLSLVNTEKIQLDQTLRQPGNAEVFQRSILLNALVERKAISWTRIFADLERVKPYNVRVVAVRLPKIHSHQEVSLDMTFGMESWEPSQDLLNTLAASPLFGPAVVTNWEPPGQNQKLYQYHITVEYGQKL